MCTVDVERSSNVEMDLSEVGVGGSDGGKTGSEGGEVGVLGVEEPGVDEPEGG
jgi:hypothetical protein